MAHTLLASFLAACLFLSACAKWRAAPQFYNAIGEYSALAWVPLRGRQILGRALLVVEVAIAVLIVVPQTSFAGSLGAVCLFLVFTAVVSTDSRTTIGHCGCWHEAAGVPKSVLVVRSLVLLTAAVLVVALAATTGTTSETGLASLAASIALTAPFALLVLEAPGIAGLINASIRPR